MAAGLPSVARVVLIASEARQEELSPWLRVVGEPVRYELVAASAPTSEMPAALVVIDGGSICTCAKREEVLQRSSGPFTTILYVMSAAPSEDELTQAFVWANDSIDQGPDFGERLRRRVETIALAPWRRSAALRAEAERLGEGRIRVLRQHAREERAAEPEEIAGRTVRHPDRALPFVLAERAWKAGGLAPSLVASAFHEGRRVGVASSSEMANDVCEFFLRELNRTLATSRGCGEQGLEARFGGATYAVGVIRDELVRRAREELEAIDRHEARSAEEGERW